MTTLLTINQLSTQLSISKQTIYYYVSTGVIPHVRIGGLIRFIPEDIEKWISRNKSNSIDKGR